MQITRTIESTPAKLYTALTNATAICEWLCYDAQLEPSSEGRVYLYWRTPKYYVMGEFISVQPYQSLSMLWHTAEDPTPVRVDVSLHPEGNATKVIYSFERPIGSQLESLLVRGLAVLEATQTQGVHLDVTERPWLGVVVNGEINSENAAQYNLPINHGIIISGTIAGLSGEAAGLVASDVLSKLADTKLEQLGTIAQILQQHKAGDSLELEFYRNGERHNISLTLKSRVLPTFPHTASELAEQVCKERGVIEAELAELMENVSQEAANKRPSETAWSANHVLAHLILAEQEYQTFVAGLVVGTELETFSSNLDARVEAMLERYPTSSALLEEFKQTNLATKAMLQHLPSSFVEQRSSIGRILLNAELYTAHPRQHMAQIRRALQS
ncbi:MAG: SRPBCC domain-containing protein [Deinococcales bacterium]